MPHLSDRSARRCTTGALTAAIAIALSGVHVQPAAADVGAGWDSPRPLPGLLAGNGLDQAVARWVDTSPDADHKQSSLRLAQSPDDGRTFTDTVDAPAPSYGAPRSGSVADLAVGPRATETWVLSSTHGPEQYSTRLQADWYSSGFSTWGNSSVIPAATCLSSSASDVRPQIAVGSTSVVVVDACLAVHRTEDGGGTWQTIARLDNGLRSARSLVLTTTASGFSLVFSAVPEAGDTPRLFSTHASSDAVFAAPTQISPATTAGTGHVSVAVSETTGTLVVASNLIGQRGSTDQPLQTEVRRSSDSGATWSAPQVVRTSALSAAGYEGAPATVVATDAGFDLIYLGYDSTGARSWRRLRSPDDGSTWTATTPPPALSTYNDFGMSVSASGGTRVHLLRDGQFTRSVNAPRPPVVVGVAHTADTLALQLSGDSDTTGYTVRWARGTTPPPSTTAGEGGWSGPGPRATLTALPAGDLSVSVFATSTSPVADEAPSQPTTLVLRRTLASLSGGTTTTAYATARTYNLTVGTSTGEAAPATPLPQLWGRVRGTTTWKLLGTGARVTVAPTATMELQAFHPGTTRTRTSRSNILLAPVQAKIVTALSASTIVLGRSVTLTTTVAPSHAGKSVSLQRYSSGAWRTLTSKTLSSTSKAAFTIRPTVRGKVQYRVAMSAHADHALSVSAPRTLTTS